MRSIFLAPLATLLAMIFANLQFAAAANAADCAKNFGTFGLKKNSQIAIWELEMDGRGAAAKRLKTEVENSLKNSKITSFEVDHGRTEITDLTILDFADGRRGVWKTWNLDWGASKKEIMHEVSAYQFDQLIGAGIVPVTVTRSFQGRPGIVQLFVRDTDSVKLTPAPHSLKLFDFLINAQDRVSSNHLMHAGRTVAIDNGAAFGAKLERAPDFVGFINEQLEAVAKAGNSETAKSRAANEIAATLINKDVVANLRALSDEQVKAAMPGLNATELGNLLKRKKQALAAIEKAEQVLGKSIYPSGRFSALTRESAEAQSQRLRAYAVQPKLDPDLKSEAQTAVSILDRARRENRSLTPAETERIREALHALEADR